MWPAFTSKNCTYVGLTAAHRNNFSAADGGAFELDASQPLPLRFARSSHKNDAIDGFLGQAAS